MMKFEKTPSKINRGIAIIIYSDPGVGKTTLSATLPQDETLIINTEAGLGPLLGTGHVVWNLLAAIKDYEIEKTIDELYLHLRTQKHPFKYVVLDNISELNEQLVLNLTRRRGKDVPELKEFGDAAFKMRQWIHDFRDLVYQDINVVFNAWEAPLEIRNNEGVIITRTFPMCGKKVSPQICGIVDVVMHLEVHEKTGKRWLRIGPSDQYITKTQFKGLDSVGEVADLPAILGKIMHYDYSKEG